MHEPAAFVAEHPCWHIGSTGSGFDLALKLQVFECLRELEGHIHFPALAALRGQFHCHSPAYFSPKLQHRPLFTFSQ